MTIEKDPTGNSTDVERFGLSVRKKRLTKGWSLEALAAEAFSNSTRKGYISQIENAKIPNITSESVRSVARALDMSIEEVPPSLRWLGAIRETSPNSAYSRAVELLSSARRDFLDFERMYLSVEDANRLFHKNIIYEHFMCLFLNSFFWKREGEGEFQIFGKSFSEGSEPSQICSFEVPESWIGCGVVSISYLQEDAGSNERKEFGSSDPYDLLLNIYLGSPNPRDFSTVFYDTDEDLPLAFLAVLRLNPEQVRRFYQDARENFEDIE